MSNYNKQFHMRQSDLITKEAMRTPITVIGAGGIGSHTIMALARMGYYNLTVYDMDNVSEHNLNNQGFDIEDIGKNKAIAIADKVSKAIGFKIKAIDKIYDGSDDLSNIVIAAVDSMAARKNIFQSSQFSSLFINPAMAAEFARISCYEPKRLEEDRKSFFKDWYSDDDASQDPCTAKSTIYTTNLIAGMIAKIVKDYTHGDNYIKSLDWNIGKNAMVSYSNDGTLLNS